jgi:hypothetical protein
MSKEFAEREKAKTAKKGTERRQRRRRQPNLQPNLQHRDPRRSLQKQAPFFGGRREMTQHLQQQAMGAPGLAFETWDPCNGSSLESRLFLVSFGAKPD